MPGTKGARSRARLISFLDELWEGTDCNVTDKTDTNKIIRKAYLLLNLKQLHSLEITKRLSDCDSEWHM
jgi:hypothetical protein